jgi:hypothetical protein
MIAVYLLRLPHTLVRVHIHDHVHVHFRDRFHFHFHSHLLQLPFVRSSSRMNSVNEGETKRHAMKAMT